LLVRYEETSLLRFGIEAGANACLERPEACVFEVSIQFLGGGGRYTARAHAQPPPPPSEAARPALMSRAAHAVESKAVVRIEVAVSPRHYSVFLSCPLHPALFHPPGAGSTPGERSAQVSACRMLSFGIRGQGFPSAVSSYEWQFAASGCVCRPLDRGCAQWTLLTARSGREEQRLSRFAACRSRSREGEVGCSRSSTVSTVIM
jgi:hypothetical protein